MLKHPGLCRPHSILPPLKKPAHVSSSSTSEGGRYATYKQIMFGMCIQITFYTCVQVISNGTFVQSHSILLFPVVLPHRLCPLWIQSRIYIARSLSSSTRRKLKQAKLHQAAAMPALTSNKNLTFLNTLNSA